MSASSAGNFDSASAVELSMLRRLSEDLIKVLDKQDEPEDQKTMKLELTADGLKISIFDRSRRPIFKRQSAEFTAYGDWVMSTLAWQISLYASFSVELDGHTESGLPPLRDDYGNWEISSDRAAASRRKLIEHGVVPGQIRKVAGFGDTVPMPRTNPEDESNRRITVMLKVRASRDSGA